MTRLRAIWRSLHPAVRAGITTGWQAFAGTAFLAVLGLLDAVRDWAEGGPQPDFSQPTRLLAAATAAFAAAVLTTFYRFARPPAASYPDAELTET